MEIETSSGSLPSPIVSSRPRFRLASIGLVVVLVCLVGFALFSALLTRADSAAAIRAAALSDDYQDARYWVGAEESLERQYRLEPSPTVLAAHHAAADSLVAALQRVRADGDNRDRAIVATVLIKHTAYVDATWYGVFPAVLAHDAALVLHYDRDITDPAFAGIQDAVFTRAKDEHAEAVRRLAALGLTQERLLYAAPIIFGLGLLLLYTLWRVVWGRLRAADQAARLEVLHDVERLRREKAVEHQARLGAERLALLRSDFVGSVSHELRTPLTAIVGFGELLQLHWEKFSEPQRLLRLAQIVGAAHRQQQLVEDLLLLNRLDSDRLEIATEPTAIGGLVRAAAAEIERVYPGQRIVMSGSAEACLKVDSSRTIQILTNLLDNAAKYSTEGRPIRIMWGQEDDMIVIRVRDEGCGIPEDGRAHLFTRFGRVPGSRIRAGRVGTGLGLYISRGLAEAMGGDLDLESTGPAGSTFRLRLPRAERTSAA